MTSGKLLLLATGGTIAGRGRPPAEGGGYESGAIGVADLVAGVPELAAYALRCETLAAIDSKDMRLDIWRRLALRCADALDDPALTGVVITHGTDTLEETAWFLHRALAPRRPVVLTGAMRPATAASPDGPQNLLDAALLASHPQAQGLLVTLGGVIFEAAGLHKRHGWRLDAFAASDAGPLGSIRDGALDCWRPWPSADASFASRVRHALQENKPWPWVDVVHSHAGADGRVVDALCEQGVHGLVVAATGAAAVHVALEQALHRAMAAGVAVRVASRCAGGPWRSNPQHGLPMAAEATPSQARVSLMLELLQAA